MLQILEQISGAINPCYNKSVFVEKIVCQQLHNAHLLSISCRTFCTQVKTEFYTAHETMESSPSKAQITSLFVDQPSLQSKLLPLIGENKIVTNLDAAGVISRRTAETGIPRSGKVVISRIRTECTLQKTLVTSEHTLLTKDN